MSELERQVQSLLQACFKAAEGLEAEDWLNRRFLQLEGLILEDGELGPELSEIEREISESWNLYANTPVLPQEVTVLTRVFHLLMTEVYQHWMLALDLADDTATEDCLAAAEWASRLTSVLESLNDEVRERVAA